MLIWHKLLPVFLLPLGFGIVVLLLGGLFRRRWLVWVGVAWLWAMSAPVTGDGLIRLLERGETRIEAASLERADAVVVLGGIVRQVPGVRLGEWGETADRFEAGVELFRAGKAPLLLFMGAKMPWAPDERIEGAILRERAMEIGISGDSVKVSEKVANTADEARAARTTLAGIDHPGVILVTSAFHMPRAAMLFRREGIEVQEFPVDFRTAYYSRRTPMDFLPQANGLKNSELALREIMGILYYRVFGG